MSNFYDGTKLLSLKDIKGETPEVYMCTSNRSGGKTTFFGRYLVRRWLNRGEKFALLYRYNYELMDVEDKFFKEIGQLFFKGMAMTSKRKAKGKYLELYLDEVNCGYAICINDADTIKKYSHLFSDVQSMLLDEFQSETNHYCPNEITKFISIHTSIARGGGKQVRYLPVYMISNPVSILNPYYTALGISNRLKEDVKFLRGNGYVLEQGYVQSASDLNQKSKFNQAFASNEYINYASQAVYLNDNKAFIETPTGKQNYIATIKCGGKYFGIKEFPESSIIYCDEKPDMTHRNRIVVSSEDHQVNYVMLKKNDFFIENLRWFFEKGCFRFQTLQAKEAVLKMLTY